MSIPMVFRCTARKHQHGVGGIDRRNLHYASGLPRVGHFGRQDFRQDLIDNGLDILVGSDGLKLALSQFILSNRVDPTDCLASKEAGCDASMPRRR